MNSTNLQAPHYVVFSTPPVILPLLGPNIPLSTLFSNTLSLCSSLNVSNNVTHPHTTTGKITVLYTLIFIFSDSKLEYKRFCTVELQVNIYIYIYIYIKRWDEKEKWECCEKGSEGQYILVIVRYITTHPPPKSFPCPHHEGLSSRWRSVVSFMTQQV